MAADHTNALALLGLQITKNVFEQRLQLIDFSALQNRYERKSSADVLEEYKRFLVIKCVLQDYDAILCSPSFCVHEMWRLHVLDTKRYLGAMKILFDGDIGNKFIHFDIDKMYSEIQKRYVNTFEQYRILFGTIPDKRYWDDIGTSLKLFIQTLTHTTFVLNVRSIDTIKSIKSKIQQKQRISVGKPWLVFRGKQLSDDDKIVSDYNMVNGSKLQLMSALASSRMSFATAGYVRTQYGNGNNNNNVPNEVKEIIFKFVGIDIFVKTSTVKTLAGKTLLTAKLITLRGLRKTTRIEEIKEKLQELEGIPTKHQRLIFAGRILDDHRTLGNGDRYDDIAHQCTLHLVTRAGFCYEISQK